jgi:hypothetical protein
MGGSAGLAAGGGAAAARAGGTNDFVLVMAPNLSCTRCSEPSDARFEL